MEKKKNETKPMKKGGRQDLDASKQLTIPRFLQGNESMTAKLLKKQMDLKELNNILTKKRQEFDARMRKAEFRRSEINRKEELLINAIEEFEIYVEERETKITNAESKYESEKGAIEKLDKELEMLNEQMKYLQEKEEILKKRVDEFSLAKDFLEKVVESTPQFNDVDEIIVFYDTLITIHQELTANEESDLKFIDEEREKLSAKKAEDENRILGMTNEVYKLQQIKEKIHNEALSAEATYNNTVISNTKSATHIRKFFMAISSMYMAICTYKNENPVDCDVLQKLDKISEFIQDWIEVVPAVQKKLLKKQS